LVADLWTPKGVVNLAPSLAGRNVETGRAIVVNTFRFKDAQSGRGIIVKIPSDDSMSKAQVEDMAASAFETWLTEIRSDGKGRAPTAQERKEIGRALEEFRQYALKRRDSTNKRIYYPV